jgi:hypothetical protein
MLLGDCAGEGLPLKLLLCVTAWLIEEMPHGKMAGFCLAAPRNYVLGEGS